MISRVAIIIMCVVVFLPIHSEVKAMTADEIYSKIKEYQEIFPFPVPTQTIKVGTFNASTGRFEGHISSIHVLDPVKDVCPGGKCPAWPPTYQGDYLIERFVEGGFVKMRRTYAPKINSPFAKLQFEVVNASGITVTALGKSETSPPGAKSVTIDVWESISVPWAVSAGGKSYNSKLIIRRSSLPPVIGAGVFTIPALPLSVIYEPPPDKQKTTYAKYTTTQYIGTTTKVAFSTERSTTRPVSPTGYSTVPEAQSNMRTAAFVIEKYPSPYTAIAAKALRAIADGLGKMSATETTGYAETRQSALMLKSSVEQSYSTEPNDGGPGIGDIIIYLKNVKFLWLVNGGQLKLTLLGCEGNRPKLIGVYFLKRNLQNKTMTGLDPSVGQALLNLDPFVAGGPRATLPDNRYDVAGTADLRGAGAWDRPKFTHDFSQTDLSARSDFTSRVEDYRKGWLSFLGLGVQADETVRFTSSHSSTTETVSGVKTEVELGFFGALDEIYIADVFFDRIFGTFAFRSVPPLMEPVVSGKAIGIDGKPLIKKSITLRIGTKSFVTMTDEKGSFGFRASTIPSGQASLIIDNKVYQRVSLSQAKPVRGVQLQQSR